MRRFLAGDAGSAGKGKRSEMHENEIGDAVIDAAFAVHTKFGPGLLESFYEAALAAELRHRELRVERQVAIEVEYQGEPLGVAFRADLLIERKVLVELKSVEALHNVHKKQTLTYLKLGDWRLGYLMNFNTVRLKDGVVRIVNNLQ